ncbi:MAG: thermonuclease family protein [Acidobacteriia bacterium]|nr:thermonuclease family protein [Terriglobia bacterium]
MSPTNRGPAARLLVGAGLVLGLAVAVRAAGRVETGRVVWVSDGDTITVRIGEVKEKVRLIGIDTPELDDARHAWRDVAYQAREYARSRLLGRTVTLERDPLCANRDRYGRLLRYVALDDGTDVNEEMIRRGFARAYTRFKFVRTKRYESVEDEARKVRRGRWSLTAHSAS